MVLVVCGVAVVFGLWLAHKQKDSVFNEPDQLVRQQRVRRGRIQSVVILGTYAAVGLLAGVLALVGQQWWIAVAVLLMAALAGGMASHYWSVRDREVPDQIGR